MGEKAKLMQYLEYKGVSKSDFYRQTGLSMGFLDKGVSLGADKVKIIINQYPDLSLRWLVMDEGPMIEDDQKPETQVGDVDRWLQLVSSQQETIASLQRTVEKLIDGKNDARAEAGAGCAGAAGA